VRPSSRRLAIGITGLALLAAPGAASAAIVTNGDFETGNLSGWQIQDPSGPGGPNRWYAYSGTSAPVSPNTLIPPPQGSFAAVTDMGGPGNHFLYQDITLPAGGAEYQLSLLAYYQTSASISSPDSLSPSVSPNQQYRIDVIRPTAPIESVASADILLPVFGTKVGDPSSMAPSQKTADLSAFAGQTVRLRFAEVDNQAVLNASTDAVAVNGLTVGKAKPNKKKGTASLPVTITDSGTVTLAGKGVKQRSAPASKSVTVGGAGTVKLLVKPKGKTKRKLNETGKAKAKVTITYTPNGAPSISDTAKIKLKKKS
jgi:hypothetical protein